jgi:hypothetical protein
MLLANHLGAFALFSLAVLANGDVPRRRAVLPGDAGCTPAALADGVLINDVVVDDTYVYFSDSEVGALYRVTKAGGGARELLATFPSGEIARLAVDATSVYVTTIPLQSASGTIYAVPKRGGAPRVLVENAIAPIDIRTDGDFVYWVSAGTNVGFLGLARDGSIHRIRKDGRERQTVAANLSAPFGMAFDETDVYFVESGFEVLNSGPTGVRSVPKGGGAVRSVLDVRGPMAIALSSDRVFFWAGKLSLFGLVEEGHLLSVPKSGGTAVELLAGRMIASSLTVAGDRLYFVHYESSTGEEKVASIPLGGGTMETLRTGGLAIDRIAVDDCAVYYGILWSVNRLPRL